MLILSEINQIEDFFYTEIQKDFDIKMVNFSERLRVIPDTSQYRDDDAEIWEQKTGRKPKYYQIYFDSEFVCGFDSTFPPEGIKLLFFRNLKQLSDNDKIVIDSELKKLKEIKEQDIIKQKKFEEEIQISKIKDKDTRELITSLRNKNATAKKANKRGVSNILNNC